MNISEASYIFETLVVNHEMEWEPGDISKLSPFAAEIVESYLEDIKWEIGSLQLAGHVCLKLNDPYLQYLDIGPENFIWFTDGHTQSIHPDEVSIYLVKKGNPGINVRVLPDRTLVLEKDGQEFFIPHPKVAMS